MSSVTKPGTWGDVFVDANGVIGCAYDTITGILIEYYTLVNQDGHDVPTLIRNDFIQLGERPLFSRVDKNNLGHILGMGQGAVTGKFLFKSIGGNYPNPNKFTYGTSVCDLVATPTGFRYIVQVSASHYYDSAYDTELPIPGVIWGTSNGFIQLLDGPIWADLERAAVPEMFYPYDQLGIKVGEGRTDPAHIQALESGKQKNIYNGIAERPRCCYDGQSNIFAISSRSPQGVTFNFLRLPLPDVSVIILPPNPDPTEPIMGLPAGVIDTLDKFFRAKCKKDDEGNVIPPTGEDNVRELCIDADEQVAFEHPNQGWGTKRADKGRPVSKDAIAQKIGVTLFAYDMVSGAGTSNPTFVYKKATAMDITGQVFIGPGDDLDDGAKFTPQNHLDGVVITPPDNGGDNGNHGGGCPNPVWLEDPELIYLAEHLEKKYASPRESGGLGRGPTSTFVDPLGASRWRMDYMRHRDNGLTQKEAWKAVNKAINDIIGLNPDVDPNVD